MTFQSLQKEKDMNDRHKISALLVLAALPFLPKTGYAQSRFEISKDDVVVFAGGTNMVRLQQAGYFEAILTQAYADAHPKFRDLAWEADTVFAQGTSIERWRKDGFGNRDEQLNRVGTTMVIAQFGGLESMQGKERLDAFIAAYQGLIDSYQSRAQRVVLVSPSPFEKPPSLLIRDLTRHNAVLALYVKAIAQIAKQRKLLFVDLFHGSPDGLTENGMHIKAEAQADVARRLARKLGIPTLASHSHGAASADADAFRTTSHADFPLEKLRWAVMEKHRLWYDYWRPANWKLLFGDDARREFTKGGQNYVPFREEWKRLIPMIAQAEERIWRIAQGKKDPGHNRPAPEVLHGDENANIENELDAFSAAEGLDVNLFASEKEGLTSPLAIRWDPAGRMYVTVTTTYPHVFPGDIPNDKIIVLEDIDRDGTADRSTVFAEGLNIPTGLELGDGGVYVGQATELLFLQDTTGDGKADLRRVVLGGFGNGDSHQTINSFVWSPGGELYFGQGDGCESRVETPWGSSHLFQAGFYRFRPRRLQLHPLLDDFMGPGNPWGVAFDRWGQVFSIDGAGGVTFLSPGMIPTTHRKRLGTIGKPGGYCGIAYLDGSHLPKSMHGNFAIGDFKSNQVKRFAVKPEGAGFDLKWKSPLLRSKHRNFRPVDVKLGPDGAIYVVDWYNPITCHQDDAYRDPTRDKAHGRIWRLSSKLPHVRPLNLMKAELADVLDALKSSEHWTRYQAKRALTQRDSGEVATALKTWVAGLDLNDEQYEHHLYEALGAFATIEVVEPRLLTQLLQAKDPRARAFATRIVGRWHDRIENPLELLASRVTDQHPQVRMEAVMACAAVPSSRSIELAARVVDYPVDEWLDYVLTQAVHHLEPHWLPAFKRGADVFARPRHLAAVLNKSGGKDVLASLVRVAESKDLDNKIRSEAMAAIYAIRGSGEFDRYLFDKSVYTTSDGYDADFHATTLEKLIEVVRWNGLRPKADYSERLNQMIDDSHAALRTGALMLAGIWKVEKSKERVLAVAQDSKLPMKVRAAAFGAIAELRLETGRSALSSFADKPNSPEIRAAAIGPLATLDPAGAAELAVGLFIDARPEEFDFGPTLDAFLDQKDGTAVLAKALETADLKPSTAEALLGAVYAAGRSDDALVKHLNGVIGVSGKVPDHSPAYVQEIVAQALAQGDAQRGALVFKSKKLGCLACHKVGNNGGIVGPELTAIGTTLSIDRITEELLWPQRQVKEGYTLLQVITAEGKILQGYEQKTRDSQESGDVILRDAEKGKFHTIKKDQIELRRTVGSAMPTGLTAGLTKPQVFDLIRYLSQLNTP